MCLSKAMRGLVAAAAMLPGAAAASGDVLVLGGNPPSSVFYAYAQALAATASKHSTMKVDVLPQGGTVFFPMFGTREVDMGLVSPIDALLPPRRNGHSRGPTVGKATTCEPSRWARRTGSRS